MSRLWKSFLNLCLVKMKSAATLDTTPSSERARITGETSPEPGTGSDESPPPPELEFKDIFLHCRRCVCDPRGTVLSVRHARIDLALGLVVVVPSVLSALGNRNHVLDTVSRRERKIHLTFSRRKKEEFLLCPHL